jgi:hypothetical protein
MVNDANTEASLGGAYGREEEGRCIITLLPGSVHGYKVNLTELKQPLVVREELADQTFKEKHSASNVEFVKPSVTLDNKNNKDIVHVPVYSPNAGAQASRMDQPATVSAEPGFEDDRLFDLPAQTVIENSFSIDRTYLKPTSNGCTLPGFILKGAFISGDVSGVSFIDSGIPGCDLSYLPGFN